MEGDKPQIIRVDEFEKDIHKLRKYNSIEEDVQTFIQALKGYFHNLNHPTFHAKILTDFSGKYCHVYKATKVRCKYLRSTKDLRIVYTYDSNKNVIILIAIYAKNKQENHDVKRIKRYLVLK